MKEEEKKPGECLHCNLIETINAHAAAYGTGHAEALEALGRITRQIVREMLGGEQYPGEQPPAGTAKH